jgi:DNA polymerase
MKAKIDFETYSEAGYVVTIEGKVQSVRGPGKQGGISVVGACAYANHPSTEITRLSYLIPGHPLYGWNPGDPPPVLLFEWIASGGLVEAHNAEFESFVWDAVAVRKLGWPSVPLGQWRCSQAQCRKHGLPGKLELASKILGSRPKDMGGNAVMMKLCRPWAPTKKRPEYRFTCERFPDLWDRQALYCDGDVLAEHDLSRYLPELTGADLASWAYEFRMNHRGAAIDTRLCRAAIELFEEEAKRANLEIANRTGGAVSAFSEREKILTWLGGKLPNLTKETIDLALESNGILNDNEKRVLKLRQVVAGGSVTKYSALLNWTDPNSGRLRGAYIWHGTHPGRHTGTGPQPANLPRGDEIPVTQCSKCRTYQGPNNQCSHCLGPVSPVDWGITSMEQAITDIKALPYDEFVGRWGLATPVLSSCLRGAFVAAPGCELISSDYTAIQAVVLAALAGEEWRLEVFRTHGQIYLASASAITGEPIESYLEYKKKNGHHHPMRRLGKVAELASGFQGWINSWKVFGADKFLNDDEIKDGILRWRDKSPYIVHLWYRFEDCAISAVMRPGEIFEYTGVKFYVRDNVLIIQLRSGRELWYRSPKVHQETRKYLPSRRIWPDYAGPRDYYGFSYEGYNSDASKGPIGWLRRPSWGGKFTENIVMGHEVDIMLDRKLALEKAGYPGILETYDEITTEVTEGFGSIEELERIMTSDLPVWCKDWPIKAAGGWRGSRFRKG